MNVFKKALMASIAIAGVAMASNASAATYVFNLTGDKTANFTINTEAMKPVLDGTTYQYNSVKGTFQGFATTASSIRFYDSGSSGGFRVDALNNSVLIDAFGPQLFSSSSNNLVFNLGNFSLTNAGAGSLRLSITAAAVPEPATWAMMLLGFGMVAGAARYRRRSANVSFA